MSFSFNPEEAWNAGSAILPSGDHLCEVQEVDASKDSSGGFPQVEVKVGNATGDIRDWIVISSPQTFGKFTALVLAAGVSQDDYPRAGTDFDASTGRISQAYAARLVGRKLGVIVRDEPSLNDPSKLRPRVQGYVPASRIRSNGNGNAGSAPVSEDMPADTRGLPTPSSRSNDPIPF